MSRPNSPLELLELVMKSELVEPQQLENFRKRLLERGLFPDTPIDLAQMLVFDKLLTNFQAKYLLLGKWRNFIIKGKFMVMDRLGAGGESTVLLCQHRFMNRCVALKVLPPESTDPKVLTRFRREAALIACLDHPNIVRVHDVDSDGHLHYMVMEFIEGINLQSLVDLRGVFSIERAVNVTVQALKGLHHAHQFGVVHRDVKPANLLLDRQGLTKLSDFGLARINLPEDTPTQAPPPGHGIMGTVDYIAPEQALDPDRADIRADLYSLGGTFRFLLLGKPPFPGGSVASKLIAHQQINPEAPHQIRAEVPEEISRVIEKMMRKDPAQRYATPAEAMTELMPWFREVPPMSMNVSLILQEQNEAAAEDTGKRPRTDTDYSTPRTSRPKSSAKVAG
jgi:serine/threonine protein kinase